jgi:protein-S-isoprenylcysteine O-methyltransferase Ste14
VSCERILRGLALLAMIPPAATFYFFVFWHWFETWRRHQVLTYGMMFATFAVLGAILLAERQLVLDVRFASPPVVQGIGWALIAGSNAFGWIADRQIGLRVRSFTPFFETPARIELRTTGAYGVVRHPIYASGIWFQLGVLLASGYAAVAVACLVFTLGAMWFTRQEERRLRDLLEDPTAYDRYRQRVPSLFPWFRRGR